MTIEHVSINDPNIHEPKGVATAVSGSAYVANGAGSGVWEPAKIQGQGGALVDTVPVSDGSGGVNWGPAIINASDLTVDRILDGISVSAAQEPTGTDAPMQLEFGPAVNSGSDPVMLSVAGALTFNEAGTYRLKISFSYGRTGGAGVSELYFRALVDGVQAGQSIHAKVGDADVYIPFTDETWLTVPAATVITYELLRDSAGNDSGGLFSGNPTLAGWNDNPCAAIRVERWTS